jgi:hypothetical protein
VNHLDNRREDGVRFGKFAGGFAREEDEEWAEHLAAESGNMFAEGVDAGEFAVEFLVEAYLDGVEFGTDAFAERIQNGGGGARLWHIAEDYMDGVCGE